MLIVVITVSRDKSDALNKTMAYDAFLVRLESLFIRHEYEQFPMLHTAYTRFMVPFLR